MASTYRKSRGEIEKTLNKVKKYGIETVFLETYYQGKTIFPSETFAKYGVQPQRPEFIGFDPLQIWVEEAHKRGLKIYIWFETYYAGPENPMKKSDECYIRLSQMGKYNKNEI